MNWVFHDSFLTAQKAKSYGNKIIKLGLSKGAKIKKNKKRKKRSFDLYIVPFMEK